MRCSSLASDVEKATFITDESLVKLAQTTFNQTTQ
jgi:hypothetical protein